MYLGTCPNRIFQPGSVHIISGSLPDPQGLLSGAWRRIQQAYRPSTAQAHKTHFQSFLAVMLFYGLPIELSPYNVLIFLEFLTRNQLSPKVIRNFLASLSSVSQFYNLDTSALSHPSILRFVRSLIITINSTFRPTPRGVFDIRTMYDISRA